MEENVDSQLVFSNAVLEGFLKYIKKNSSDYEKFLSALGVDGIWISDKNQWHDAHFLNKFFAEFQKLFPNNETIIKSCVKSLYVDSSNPLFSSLTGLLLKPEKIFQMLPKAVTRMNLYNSYEFQVLEQNLAISKVQLTQNYLDIENISLNSKLCQSAKGSIEGIVQSLGYYLLNVQETKCVNKGDSCCAFEISWVNKTFLSRVGVFFISFAMIFSVMQWGFPEVFTRTIYYDLIISFLGALSVIPILQNRKNNKRLLEAFNYQQETLEKLRESSFAVSSLNKAIIDHQKELSESYRLAAFGEISYGVVHDMATPITLIDMSAKHLDKIINEHADEKENMDRIETVRERISTATYRLIQMQNLIRALIKSDGSASIQEIHFSKIIREILDLFHPLFRTEEIIVEEDLDPDIVIYNLEGRIESILMNIIQNAAKYLKHVDDRKIIVKTKKLEDSVSILIQDTGPGIPPERLKSLWNRFGISRSNGSQSIHGSGFGLYQIKKNIELLQGRIDVSSSPQGTVFEITIPLKYNEDYYVDSAFGENKNAN